MRLLFLSFFFFFPRARARELRWSVNTRRERETETAATPPPPTPELSLPLALARSWPQGAAAPCVYTHSRREFYTAVARESAALGLQLYFYRLRALPLVYAPSYIRPCRENQVQSRWNQSLCSIPTLRERDIEAERVREGERVFELVFNIEFSLSLSLALVGAARAFKLKSRMSESERERRRRGWFEAPR